MREYTKLQSDFLGSIRMVSDKKHVQQSAFRSYYHFTNVTTASPNHHHLYHNFHPFQVTPHTKEQQAKCDVNTCAPDYYAIIVSISIIVSIIVSISITSFILPAIITPFDALIKLWPDNGWVVPCLLPIIWSFPFIVTPFISLHLFLGQ